MWSSWFYFYCHFLPDFKRSRGHTTTVCILVIKDILALSDIDECTQGSHDCLPDLAACINTEGSYSCNCNVGYTGDGKISCQQLKDTVQIKCSAFFANLSFHQSFILQRFFANLSMTKFNIFLVENQRGLHNRTFSGSHLKRCVW